MLFYKALLKTNLCSQLIPGTVTNDLNEAILWLNRYSSKKQNGITRHIKQGDCVIIQFNFDETLLLNSFEFQRKGVTEHERLNCWTSIMKQKAQINSVIINWIIFNYI